MEAAGRRWPVGSVFERCGPCGRPIKVPFKFTAKRFRALINACEQWRASDPGGAQPNLFVGYARVLMGYYAGAAAALANYERLTPLPSFGRILVSKPDPSASKVIPEWSTGYLSWGRCPVSDRKQFAYHLQRSPCQNPRRSARAVCASGYSPQSLECITLRRAPEERRKLGLPVFGLSWRDT